MSAIVGLMMGQGKNTTPPEPPTPIVPTFSNGDFSGPNFSYNSGSGLWTTTGWAIGNTAQVWLNGTSTIGGWPTPVDPTPTPYSSPGEATGTMTYSFELENVDIPPGLTYPPSRACRLYSNGQVSVPYGIVNGPYLVSTTAVNLNNGDSASFYWRAAGGSDAYNVFSYLLNVDTGQTIILFDQTAPNAGATTSWAQVIKTIDTGAGDTAGNYKFVFVCGSYDATGGQALGASLYVTDIVVTKV